MTGKLPLDSNYDLEQQFIFRITDSVAAENLAADIDAGIPFKENFTIEFKPDMRHTIVRYNGQVYQGQIMDLPCIIESLKTTDRKNFYKTANICQMMICTQGDETGPVRGTAAYLDNRPGSRNRTFDISHENREFQFLHGITPPLKNVLHRRFRKTRRKRFVDMPKIEKEVKQLLRADLQAVNVKWEVIWTDPPAHQKIRLNTDSNNHNNHSNSNSNNNNNNNQSNLSNNEIHHHNHIHQLNNGQQTADDEIDDDDDVDDDDDDGGRAYAIDHRDVFGGEISSSSIGSSSDSDDNSSSNEQHGGDDDVGGGCHIGNGRREEEDVSSHHHHHHHHHTGDNNEHLVIDDRTGTTDQLTSESVYPKEKSTTNNLNDKDIPTTTTSSINLISDYDNIDHCKDDLTAELLLSDSDDADDEQTESVAHVFVDDADADAVNDISDSVVVTQHFHNMTTIHHENNYHCNMNDITDDLDNLVDGIVNDGDNNNNNGDDDVGDDEDDDDDAEEDEQNHIIHRGGELLDDENLLMDYMNTTTSTTTTTHCVTTTTYNYHNVILNADIDDEDVDDDTL